ncbi:polysaccharide biosynthesis protein [Streptomyces sp. NPDC046831]|uniref:polysaccharide biosynthesis protein n=1 Tax=Streptomyces sp. NPDC046831 TaxID=3154805 RepID=UPI0033DE2213
MSEDPIRLVTIGRIIRRRRRLLTVLAVVGALVGYGASLVFPPRYTTSASVLLPGAWEERELLTQAEIATSSVVVDRAAVRLGWAGTGGELRDRVSAEATDGNIIRISGTADTPERAQQLSDQVARQFVAFAARIVGDGADPEAGEQQEALRRLVVRTSGRITELADAAGPGRTVESVQARTDLEKLRTTLQGAMKKLDEADPAAGRADMVVMGPAPRPDGEAPPTRIQLVVAGALLFFLLAVVGHLTAARTSRRLRSEPEIAAALGSPLLGSVDVPGERPARRPEDRGPRDRIRRLLGVDVRWDVPTLPAGDEAGRQIRCRRVCARVRDRLPAPRRLLAVVPEGDETARRAAAQLVAAAGGDPLLRVVRVSVSRPMVPDRDGESGALVVVSAGGWTAAELAGIAEACTDAGHDVVGGVLAGPVRAVAKRSGGRPRRAAAPAFATADDATGGSG